jgi:flagellar M-ring protein FliF
MEFLKKLIEQSRSHLRGLTTSQQVAIGLCVVVIAGALVWLIQWSANPDRVALVHQDLSPEELGRIQSRLDDAMADYEVRGSRIYVPPDQRMLWLARLGESQALPNDLTITFQTLMENQSPFLNMKEQDWRRGVALGNELARVLRNFTGVADARVFVDKTRQRVLGSAPVEPTASIYVRMKPGQSLDKARVFAMASLVARSVSGLNVKNVGVTDATTGRSYTVPDPNDPGSFDDLDDRRRKEEYFSRQLQQLFAHIPGLLVGVHADLDPEASRTEKTIYGKPVALREEMESSSSRRGSEGAAPGVVANTARATAGAGTAEETEKSSSVTENLGGVDKTVQVSERMRHGLKNLRASLNVPRSYFVAIFKQAKPDAGEPTDADLEELITTQLAKMKKQAMTLLAAEDESMVQVDWFYDTPMPTLAVADTTATGEALAWVKAYGGQAGLVALALVAMLVLLTTVRKASEGPVLPGEEPPKPLLAMLRRQKEGGRGTEGGDGEAEEDWEMSKPAAEAHVTEGMLVGHEVPERDVRVAQLVEQVTNLVNENPEVAASLVRRWATSD